MSNILLANTPFVIVGLGTFTYTVPSTGVYSISCQSTVPSAYPTGSEGAGTGADVGLGLGGFPGVSTNNTTLGQGGKGLGFGGSQDDNARSPSPSTGQISSSLVVTIKQNGTTKYTSPTLSPTQSAFQFRQDFLFTAADAIEIDLTSSNVNDEQLNTVKTTLNLITGP